MLKNVPDFSEEKVLKKLGKNFRVEKVNRSEASKTFYEGPEVCSMVVQMGARFYRIEAKKEALRSNSDLQNLHESVRNLNVSICRELVVKQLVGDPNDLLRHISYEVDPVKVSNGLESGEYDIAVFLAPISIQALERVARAHQVMPHKSTYFYPKLLTGLVIYRF